MMVMVIMMCVIMLQLFVVLKAQPHNFLFS